MTQSYTKPRLFSLAPPLRQVEGRKESTKLLTPRATGATVASKPWKEQMLNARAARKRKEKLQKLRAQQERSTTEMRKLEGALAALEESLAKKQQPQ